MRLSPYLRPDLVIQRLDAVGVEGVVAALADHLERTGVVTPDDEVALALAERERAHTTAMGRGMALPHATVASLERPLVLVALAPEPISFGPADVDPVRIFFVLLSPPGREGEHIKLLARICRLIRHPGFVDELMAAHDGATAIDVIRRADERRV